MVSPRLDTCSRVYRGNGAQTLHAELFGEQAFGLTELQFQLLRSIDGRRSLADVAREQAAEADPVQARSALLYLAERGAIELVP